MYSIYKRGGYPAPPVLPVGNKYCPPIPGIVPLNIMVQPVYSTFMSTISSVYTSTISTIPSTMDVSSFTSTIISPYVSTITYTNGYFSTPINYVALGNSYKSLSESGRMVEQQCTTMYISNAPVPVQRGSSNNIPYVNNIPTPASATTLSIQNAVLFAGYNPYNPATRFTQYRFADTVLPPNPNFNTVTTISYISSTNTFISTTTCQTPITVPNPGVITPCPPPLVFRGSVENVGPI